MLNPPDAEYPMAEPIAVAIVKEEIDDATCGALARTIPAATSVSSGGDAPAATDDAMLAVSSASLCAEAGGANSVVAEDNHPPAGADGGGSNNLQPLDVTDGSSTLGFADDNYERGANRAPQCAESYFRCT